MKDVEKKENKDKLKTDIAEQANEDFDTKKASPKQGILYKPNQLSKQKNKSQNQVCACNHLISLDLV